MPDYVGRYAPSPTGDLHLGNALAAVCAWARAKRAGGRVLLRIEDLDRPRVVEGASERIAEDLRALGLDFDGDVLVQSQHSERYDAALLQLREAGLLYACKCSRKDLLRAASAPHEGDEGPVYPGTCRDLALPFDDPELPVAWRFRVDRALHGRRSIAVDDRLQGHFEQDVERDVGDFIVKRKDGLIAYQLAVVVDDALQSITEVVRGRDLLSSSPRQVLLFESLGTTPPAFAHIPLWLDAAGNRVSKRNGTSPHSLRTLFARGETGPTLLARMGRVLGAVDEATSAISAGELAEKLSDDVLAKAEVHDPALE